ncbi:MAG: HD-GYP domain-containing protein [Leptothrix sp. (in: b-proteobacteria)]
MTPNAPPLLVDVRQLRLGMYVQLDLGWMAHPFPSNRFKLRHPEQIQRLIELGLQQVQVRPELSEADVLAAPGTEPAPQPTDTPASQASQFTGLVTAVANARRQQQLAAERRSLSCSERLHAEALRSWLGVSRSALSEPAVARQIAQDAAERLLNDLHGDSDTTLRVLNAAGSGSGAALHAINVTMLALMLARHAGLPEAEQRAVALGALLHDIGKLALSDTLRNASPDQGALQLRARREHVVQGVRLGMAMGLEPLALRVIAQHHELHDGSGLPQGLQGPDISRPARIVTLVNLYDNLCHPLDNRATRTPHEAQAQLFAQMRSQLDPELLAAFIKLVGVYPPGSVVQLSDGRHAVVMSVHPAWPLRPSLLVHDTAVPRDQALLLHLHQAPELSIRRSLLPRLLPRATLDYLAPHERLCYSYAHGLDHDDSSVGAAH